MKRKFFRSNIFCIFLLIIFTQFIHAQQQNQNRQRARQGRANVFTIKGKVIDWEKNYVEKALVLIPELSKSVKTDKSGSFEITQIPQGRYHVEVYAEGFQDYFSDTFNIKEDKLRYQIILMKKIEEEIVVTASRTQKLYDETAVKTEILSSREITSKAPSNLADALYETTGIRIENDCQNCNFTQCRINGMPGKYSQILIDSSPIISAMTGVYGLEQLPAEMINRIEIVKGGGSVLYGGNAIAGVINVLTKEPKENSSYIKLQQETISGKPYTNIGFQSSVISKDLNTKGYLYASYQKREHVDLNGDGFSELGDLNNTSFGFNFFNDFLSINSKVKVSLFRIFEERRGGNLFHKPPHETNTTEWIKTDQLGLSSEWEQAFSSKMNYVLSFSLVNSKRNTYYGSHKDPNAYGKTENPLLFLNSQVNFQAGNHVLSIGAQHKRDEINDEAIGYNRIIENIYHETGVFIQDDFKIGKTFSFLSGFRLNKHTVLDKINSTPRLSVLVKFSRDLNFRTSFSTGFRAPQVFDEDLHISQVGGEGMMIINSPKLNEETSYSLYSGLDYGKQIGGNLIQLSIEGFYNRLSDTFVLQEIERIENARIMERINGSGSKVYGLSLEAGLVLGPRFSLATGWTFQRTKRYEPEPCFNATEYFKTPEIYGHFDLKYKNDKLVNLNISGNYTGPMKVPHYAGYIPEDRLETTKSFFVINLKLRKPINISENSKISILFGIDNLFDSYQGDFDLGEDRDSGYVYGPRKPRTFYATFQFSL